MKTQNSNTEKLKMASKLINEVVNNQDNVSLNLLEELKRTILERIKEIDFREIKEKLEYNAYSEIENIGGNEFMVNVGLHERDVETEFSDVMSDIVEMEFQNVFDFKNYTKDTKVDFKTALGTVGDRLGYSDLYNRFKHNYHVHNIQELDKYLQEMRELEYHRIVRISFTWSYSVEGSEYWQRVFEELKEMGY